MPLRPSLPAQLGKTLWPSASVGPAKFCYVCRYKWRMLRLVLVTALVAAAGPGPLLAAQRPILRFSRQAPDDLCHGALNLKTFLFMNNICEDCFRLYRDPDVYSMCR
jgi:hypothetical protein